LTFSVELVLLLFVNAAVDFVRLRRCERKHQRLWIKDWGVLWR
jgi:hypothetical protein